MVASMGLVGLFYWMLRLSITVLTATRTQHDCNVQTLVWISITNGVRIVGIVFQLVFFYRISPCIGEQPNIRQQKVSYLLIPVVMLAQISVFVNTVVDSYRQVVLCSLVILSIFPIHIQGSKMYLSSPKHEETQPHKSSSPQIKLNLFSLVVLITIKLEKTESPKSCWIRYVRFLRSIKRLFLLFP